MLYKKHKWFKKCHSEFFWIFNSAFHILLSKTWNPLLSFTFRSSFAPDSTNNTGQVRWSLRPEKSPRAKCSRGEYRAPTKYHITRYIHRRAAPRRWTVHRDVINTARHGQTSETLKPSHSNTNHSQTDNYSVKRCVCFKVSNTGCGKGYSFLKKWLNCQAWTTQWLLE